MPPQSDTDEQSRAAGARAADQTSERSIRSGALVVREPDMKWLDIPREELVSTLQTSLFPGAKPESVAAVLDYCEAAGLNVMLKPVHIVPMNVKTGPSKWEWRDVVMPGINHYRTQASRSGVYAGKSEPEFGEPVTENLGGVAVTFPAWCKVTVWKVVAGMRVGFTATEFWTENYATKGKDTKAPNAMWGKRPWGQIAKCAEAQALRMAFPELVGGETAEEMEGKVIDLQAIEVPDHKPAAARSLDSFAGRDDGSGPSQTTGGAAQGGAEPEDAVIEEAGDGPGPTPAEVVTPTMPAKTLKAWAEKQDWKPGWEWLNRAFIGLPHPNKQELAERHHDLLWAVYHSDAQDKGPQSKAATEFADTHRLVIPPVEPGHGGK